MQSFDQKLATEEVKTVLAYGANRDNVAGLNTKPNTDQNTVSALPVPENKDATLQSLGVSVSTQYNTEIEVADAKIRELSGKYGTDLNFKTKDLIAVNSSGSFQTEIKEHQPFNPKEKENLQNAVEQSTLAEDVKESLHNALAEDLPLSEKQQEDLKLAIGELAEQKQITEEQKQDLTTAVERPLSQEQTQLLEVAVKTSQNLSTELKDELIGALKEGKPLSDDQKTELIEAYKELEETILQLDLKDYSEVSQVALKEAEYKELQQAVEHPETMTNQQRQEISKIVQEQVQGKEAETLKNALQDGTQLTTAQKEQINKALQHSLTGEVERLRTTTAPENPVAKEQLELYALDMKKTGYNDINPKIKEEMKAVHPDAWKFLGMDDEQEQLFASNAIPETPVQVTEKRQSVPSNQQTVAFNTPVSSSPQGFTGQPVSEPKPINWDKLDLGARTA